MTPLSTPQLVIEVKFRDRSRIEQLLDQGLDIDAADEKGRTALMWASAWGRNDIVELLLQRGAETDVRDRYGETALMKAARRGIENVVKTLLDVGGADSRACDNRGKTALEKALQWGKTNVAGLFGNTRTESAPPETQDMPALFSSSDALPLSETEIFKAIDGVAEPEEATEDYMPENEATDLNDTIDVLGLSLFGESMDQQADGSSPESLGTGKESTELREGKPGSTDGPSPESPSEDELMALFDSYDEEEDEHQDTVEVEPRLEVLVDTDESLEDEGSEDWGFEGADEDDDLLTLAEDVDESAPKKP